MPLFEKLENETKKISESVSSCPRCHGVMTTKRRTLTCSICGFRVQVTSRFNESRQWIVMSFAIAIEIGIGIGLVLGSHI